MSAACRCDVWLPVRCDVLLLVRCLPTSMISGNLYLPCLPICLPTYILSAQLHDVCLLYDLGYAFWVSGFSTWCLATCSTWCLITSTMSACMMSAYLYDICLLVWCHGGGGGACFLALHAGNLHVLPASILLVLPAGLLSVFCFILIEGILNIQFCLLPIIPLCSSVLPAAIITVCFTDLPATIHTDCTQISFYHQCCLISACRHAYSCSACLISSSVCRHIVQFCLSTFAVFFFFSACTLVTAFYPVLSAAIITAC